MKKRLFAGMLVLALTIGILCFLQALLLPKYASGIVEGGMTAAYYEDPSSHDVLLIGDCELYENISPITLWQEYGVTSYIRGSAQQLVWQSYYLLEDALRTEKPNLVVFNVLALKYDVPQKEAYNRMTIDGMRWSLSKWNCIRASLTEKENVLTYLFPLLRFHSRWAELSREDWSGLWSKTQTTHNGYYMRVDVKPQTGFPPAKPLADPALGENAMSYLQKMADLCKEQGISLLLIKAPIAYPYWYPQWDEQVIRFAEENGVEYVNYLEKINEIGLDMQQDTYDAGLHLNVQGAEKFASVLGSFIVENYHLKDHRGEADLDAIWQKKTEVYNAMKAQQYEELETYGELISFGANAIR